MKNKRLITAAGILALVLLGITLKTPRSYLPVAGPALKEPAPHDFAACMETGSPEQIVAAARARGAWMAELMDADPERALRAALSWSEWAALPDGAKPFVETPFSAVADTEVLIACGGADSGAVTVLHLPEKSGLNAKSFGARGEVGTKQGIALQGIHLGGHAVLRPEVFQGIDAADEAAVRSRFPVAIPDLGGASVAALFGGRVVYFKNEAALAEANRRLAALESKAGPTSASALLLDGLDAYWDADGIDFAALEAVVQAASEAWTSTPRDMYVILVEFSDLLGLPTDPAALSNSINTVVSQQINDMSYDKSHINCVVNPTPYLIAGVSTDYIDAGNGTYPNADTLHDLARAAAISDGHDLSGYDTICVFFDSIGGMGYSGLASVGGSRMWLNGSTSPATITHELGHNYGARHADFWDAEGSANPVDPGGAEIGYGDFTDIMGGGSVPAGHFNAWHKTHINWFDATNWTSVVASATYRVYRSDHRDTSGAIRGLRIAKGGGDYYWVGLRQEIEEYETFSRGAYVLWKMAGDDESDLLDLSPGSADGKYDGGLALGQTYSDPAADVHLTAVARGGETPDEWMEIQVNLGSFPGNNPPAAAIVGPTQGVKGGSMVFTVTATDPEGDALAYWWDSGDEQVKPNSPTLPVVWVAGDTGTISCVVSDMKGGTTEVSRTVVLSDRVADWTPRASGTAEALEGMAVGNGRVVAVGDRGATCYSDDGTNWTTHTDASVWAGNLYLKGVTHDGSMFIAVGMDYDGGWEQVILTSSDGTYWTKRYDSNSASGSNTKMNDVAYGGGVYIAVGDGGVVARSTDGLSWSVVASGTAIDLQGVSYGDGYFVVVGDDSFGGTNPHVVLNSTDGLSWTDQTAGTSLYSGNWLFHVEYLVDRFFAGGWSVEVHSSTNHGEDFERVLSGSYNTAGYAYGAGVYFSPAENLSGGGNVDLISYDGSHWSVQATPAVDERTAAAFFKGAFITVGKNGSIWQSGPVEAASGGFANWQRANAPELGLNRDPMDDADFDGVVNLAEYAMGSSATDAGSRPSAARVDTAGAYFEVSYPRDGIQPDIAYAVERVAHLPSNNWSAATTVVTEESPTNITARSLYSLGTQSNEFMRLRVELE